MNDIFHSKKPLATMEIFLVIVLFAFPLISSGQTSAIEDHINVKAGFSRYVSNIVKNHEPVYYNNLKLEFNHKILKNLNAGIYFGYSKFQTTYINLVDTTWVDRKEPVLFYGINANYQILPMFIKKESRWDIYLTAKLGGYYIFSETGFVPSGNDYEYAIGIGIAFYVFKHIGLFSEYTYGKYYFMDKDNLKAGISLRF
jgi:hypothetical protein